MDEKQTPDSWKWITSYPQNAPSTPPQYSLTPPTPFSIPCVLFYPFRSLSPTQRSGEIATICCRDWSHNMLNSRASRGDTWPAAMGPVTVATPPEPPPAQHFTFTLWHRSRTSWESLLSVSSLHPSAPSWCKSSPPGTFSPSAYERWSCSHAK